VSTNTTPQDVLARLRAVEADLRELRRPRSVLQPYLRDLRDCRLFDAQDGDSLVYDGATGEWVPGAAGGVSVPPFSLPGAPSVSTSGRWYPPDSLDVVRLFASLRVAGSTTTTAQLLHNGVAVATVSLAAGVLAGGVALLSSFAGPEADWMQVACTVAGTGALDLTVQPY
jgi:hypothetical protein